MSDEKKLIIDEDWKSQVQAEKEQVKKAVPSSTMPAESRSPAGMGDMPMPPASFEMLLTTLATEALVSLGQIPHPATNELHLHRSQAKYLIDTIDMLRQKTEDNLTPDERQMLETVLHQLKLAFIETAGTESGVDTPPADHLA